jgi:hypothetical protein
VGPVRTVVAGEGQSAEQLGDHDALLSPV